MLEQLPSLSPQELHWLAGILEGEGSFMHPMPSKPFTAVISMEMNDKDVIEKAGALLGVRCIYCRVRNGKETFIIRVLGKKAEEWMKRLAPLMGSRRRAKIEEILARLLHTRTKG